MGYWFLAQVWNKVGNKTVQDSLFGAQNPTKNLERATSDLHNEWDFGFKMYKSTLNLCHAILVPGFQPLVNNRRFDKNFRHSFHLTS